MACQICGRGSIAVVLCGSCVPNPIPPKPKRTPRGKRKPKAIGNCCHYCGSTNYLTTDHLHPISKGGSNDYSNLVRACNSCNNRKGNMLLEEFRIAMGIDLFYFEIKNA